MGVFDPDMSRQEWVVMARADLFTDSQAAWVAKSLDMGQQWDGQQNTLALVLNLTQSKAKLLKTVEGWIDRSTPKRRRGRPAKRYQKTKYNLLDRRIRTLLS